MWGFKEGPLGIVFLKWRWLRMITKEWTASSIHRVHPWRCVTKAFPGKRGHNRRSRGDWLQCNQVGPSSSLTEQILSGGHISTFVQVLYFTWYGTGHLWGSGNQHKVLRKKWESKEQRQDALIGTGPFTCPPHFPVLSLGQILSNSRKARFYLRVPRWSEYTIFSRLQRP